MAVICWFALRMTLCGIFADIEISESRFDFRCTETESKNIEVFRVNCFELYERLYNKFNVPSWNRLCDLLPRSESYS